MSSQELGMEFNLRPSASLLESGIFGDLFLLSVIIKDTPLLSMLVVSMATETDLGEEMEKASGAHAGL
jgi:hypothetical protein